MNEQANKILADLLQKASNGIDAAVSFSQAQVPDVIHQLLVWNAVSSLMFQAIAILTVMGFLLTVKKAWEIAEGCSGADFFAFWYIVCGALASIIMFVGFWFNFDWLKIWLAPKLYLIEYAATLIK
ncbi:hypothetical protein INP82_22585 [Citrobacter sedlakii]|uniref:hypothetical protein n=1 Tax=Citrobacter TaxID=544 RepID=UPI00196A006B|nr:MULTISPECIES: hypothetical protein [Citrobacter]MBM9570174.1 hypothetical protein [Citrobacter sedlakii]HBL4693587.1 hypothetical protein [Citrobacter sedlakii]HBL4708024.1 hypothetical protein [Citrobacter sedlakii]HBL4722121.1 hypothetical protein [Citrobacter sedlakii]HCA7843072.1 hypothetical protein [Citrobacter sedlakii]